MIETIKRTLLASLGAVAFTRDKLRSILDDLVHRGELSRDQAGKLFETLVEKGEHESAEISSRLVSETRSLRDLFPVSRNDHVRLEKRVEAIEARLGIAVPTAEASEGAAASPPAEFPGEPLPPREDI